MTTLRFWLSLELIADDCHFYGILLGYGCFNNTNQKGYIILDPSTKSDESEFCETYLRQRCVDCTRTFDNHVNKIEFNVHIPTHLLTNVMVHSFHETMISYYNYYM